MSKWLSYFCPNSYRSTLNGSAFSTGYSVTSAMRRSTNESFPSRSSWPVMNVPWLVRTSRVLAAVSPARRAREEGVRRRSAILRMCSQVSGGTKFG